MRGGWSGKGVAGVFFLVVMARTIKNVSSLLRCAEVSTLEVGKQVTNG